MKDYPLDRSITLGVNRWYCLKALLDDLLNQTGWIAYKAGRDKDTPNGKNLMEQSEISIERAKQAIYDLIEYVIDEDEDGRDSKVLEGTSCNAACHAIEHRLTKAEQHKRAKELL